MLIRAEPRELWRARCVYVPTAEEDVVRPHHGQGEQLVELRQLEVVDVPQDELPPGLPVLLALPVASVRLHLVGQGSVLLDKIVHVQGRHLAFLRLSRRRPLPFSVKRDSEVVFEGGAF